MINYAVFRIGLLPTNCYVVWDGEDSIIIDPGSDKATEIQLLKEFIKDKCLKLQAIVCTHNHFDHIQGAHYFDVPCYMSKVDINTLNHMNNYAKEMHGVDVTLPKQLVELPSTITLGDLTFDVINTPGHTSGSVSLYNEKEEFLFSGDTLFRRTCGRTDLPTSNESEMIESLKRLRQLPDKTKVFAGHGRPTTIGEEKDWIEDFTQ